MRPVERTGIVFQGIESTFQYTVNYHNKIVTFYQNKNKNINAKY